MEDRIGSRLLPQEEEEEEELVELVEQEGRMEDLEVELELDGNPRLVLHNMVANMAPNVDFKSAHYIAATERFLDESDEHEPNEQDSRGRTALHVAVLHSNVEAIAGLLMCGVDVNVADLRGKTPFSLCLTRYDMRNYDSHHMFFTLFGHVHKLLAIGLRVSEENRRCYARARSIHVFNEKQLQLKYDAELDKMEDVVVDSRTSLRDVLYQGPDVIATSVLKRRTIEDILTASDFYDEFPKLCCLLKLQYRRGLTRRKLMQPVKTALLALLGISLPDPCTETIIKHLDDDDLMRLMRLNRIELD